MTSTTQRWLLALVSSLALGWTGVAVSADPKLPDPLPDANQGQQAPSFVEHTVVITGKKTEVDIVERFSKLIEAPAKLKRVDGFDPEIVNVTADTPRRIRVQAIIQGLTQIVMTDENNKQYQVEVFVRGDARHLQAVINTRFPDSAVEAHKIQESVALHGWVSQPDHITQITEIAEQFFPKVLNHLRVGGVQQVKLKCKIMEVQRTKLRRMGFNFLFNDFSNGYISSTPGQLTTLGSTTLSPSSSGVSFTNATLGAASTAFGAVTDTFAVQAFFDALKEEQLLKILAEPVLVTMNGRPAVMLSGGEFPILVPQTLGQTTIEFRPFGVRLETVPIILGDGRVRMEVMPEVSERDFSSAVVVTGLTVPGLTVRRVNTQVEMKFGQTLLLAGLLSTRQTAQTQKIPFLGELPYAGTFFRRVRNEDVETELVIMMVPELVSPIDGSATPPYGPGQFTEPPTERELFGYGFMEVPRYSDRCGNCDGRGCPQCRQADGVPIQHFTLPVQEIHQPPNPGAEGGVEAPGPIFQTPSDSASTKSRLKTGSSVAKRTPQGDGQHVGFTQTPQSKNASTQAGFTTPQKTAPTYTRSTQIGSGPAKTTSKRPGLIQP